MKMEKKEQEKTAKKRGPQEDVDAHEQESGRRPQDQTELPLGNVVKNDKRYG